MKSRTQIFALIATLSTLTAQADNYTGAEGGDWASASNWSGGVVPTSATNVNITTPGPLLNTSGQACNILFLNGATPSSTLTIATGGDLTTSSTRVGIGTDGKGELFLNGGSLTSTQIGYVAQNNTGGSKITVNSGNLQYGDTLRLGFDQAGYLEINGGTVTIAKDIYVSQKAGSGGSTIVLNGGTLQAGSHLRIGYLEAGHLEVSGGTLQTTGETTRLDFGSGSVRILGQGATMHIQNAFRFGLLGDSLLEYVLTADGKTSPLHVGSLDLTATVNRTVRIDGSRLANADSLGSIVLLHATVTPFTVDQVAALNASLNLVGLPGSYSLALANDGADIVLQSESAQPTWGGYPIVNNDFIDTGDYLGLLYVSADPFIYSFLLNNWFFVDEASFAAGSTWIFFFR